MTRLRELVTAARAGIENLTPSEVAAEVDSGDVLLVDVREPAETARGIIPSALLAPRGLLEFCANGEATGNPWSSPDERVIVYSSCGARSALAAATLLRLGFRDVAHLDGGYRRWVADGWPVLPPHPRVNGLARQDGTWPDAHVVCAVLDDPRRAMLRVQVDDRWVGDLLCASGEEREAVLAALTTGVVVVERGRGVITDDVGDLDRAPAGVPGGV